MPTALPTDLFYAIFDNFDLNEVDDGIVIPNLVISNFPLDSFATEIPGYRLADYMECVAYFTPSVMTQAIQIYNRKKYAMALCTVSNNEVVSSVFWNVS